MKAITGQLNITEFPFEIKDSSGSIIYFEDSDGDWHKKEYDSSGKQTYYENSDGKTTDNRPKATCNGKVIEVDGKKYKLIEL
jgi:hypothetical protein